MEISRFLRHHARTIQGKSQLFINSYAKALEVAILPSFCFNRDFVAIFLEVSQCVLMLSCVVFICAI